MAEVGHVTPGKPIWPGHHGGEMAVERVTPPKDEEQGKRRQPGGGQQGEAPASPEEDHHGHVDEYV